MRRHGPRERLLPVKLGPRRGIQKIVGNIGKRRDCRSGLKAKCIGVPWLACETAKRPEDDIMILRSNPDSIVINGNNLPRRGTGGRVRDF